MASKTPITLSRLTTLLAVTGRPAYGRCQPFAKLYRAAVRAGLNGDQAFALTCEAYDAAQGYVFKLPMCADESIGAKIYASSPLRLATARRQAEEHPRGRYAEELAAAHEGRASRWGTPEFHRAAS